MLSTLLLGLAALVGLPTTAQAAEVDVVKTIDLKNTSDDSGKTTIWDIFHVQFTVDTTGTGAKAGDTFTLKFPDSMRTNITTFPMYAKDGKTEVATCKAPGGAGQTLTCTFGDYITSHPNLTGKGWVHAMVGKSDDVKDFKFEAAGKAIIKQVPGGKVNPYPGRNLPDKARKGGWAEAEVNSTLFYWHLTVNAAAFAGQDPIKIEDTFGTEHGGYKLSTEKGRHPHLLKWDSAADYKSGKWATNEINPGEGINGGTFTFTPTDKGYTASWPNNDPDAVYELRYYTNLNDAGQAKPGNSFSNVAQINDQKVEHKTWISSYGEGQLDGPGFGSVMVAKATLQGDGAGYVDSSKEYEVTAKFNVNGTDHTEKLLLTAGGDSKSIRSLPVGTKVTLSEITPKDDFSWEKPVFSSDDPGVKVSPDGSSAVVTVGDQKTAKVVVTNKVAAPTPKVDIVKKDAKGNDANTAAEAVDLTADEGKTPLKFTVTNNGTETLTDVKVSDSVTAGKAKVDNLTCTFPDGKKGTTWAGPFAVGASFPCTANLAGVAAGDDHADVARVDAKGKYTGKPVADEDAYNAKVVAPGAPPTSPAQPAPPAPETTQPDPSPSTSPMKPSATAKPKPALPKTGATVLGLGIAAVAAVAIGAGLMIARRKKNN